MGIRRVVTGHDDESAYFASPSVPRSDLRPSPSGEDTLDPAVTDLTVPHPSGRPLASQVDLTLESAGVHPLGHEGHRHRAQQLSDDLLAPPLAVEDAAVGEGSIDPRFAPHMMVVARTAGVVAVADGVEMDHFPVNLHSAGHMG